MIAFGLGRSALEEIATAIGAVAIHGDICEAMDRQRAVDACGGRVDVLVNAAGVVELDEASTIRDEQWERTMAVNATAVLQLCRAVLPLMVAVGGGAIVNVGSVAAFNSSPSTLSYAASKAAVVSLTRSIAYSHGPDGVRANCIAPGWVRTPMSEAEMMAAARVNGTTAEAEFQALRDRIALRRVAEPEEIAACCLFLASAEASFVNGAVLVVDGGGRSPTQHRAV